MAAPSVNQPLRVSFGAILLAIKARIVEITEFPATIVKLIGRSNDAVPKLIGDRDILVRASRFAVVGVQDGPEAAAGLVDTRLSRTVYVFPRVRMMRDEVDRDEFWLTNPTDGIIALEEMLVGNQSGGGLHEWFPTDADGNQLTIVGLKLINGTEPDKNIPAEPQWGDSCLAFEVLYDPPVVPGDFGIIN